MKMTGMTRYYLSRGLLSLLVGGLAYVLSSSIWMAVITALVLFGTFVILSRSGRYKVNPEKGVSALRRDEWTQAINDKSGRNAWVVVTVAGGLLVLYFGLISPGDVPVGWLGGLVAAGVITYYASDFWLRRL
jgi:hypothetical protein